jgi:hypothetical protein
MLAIMHKQVTKQIIIEGNIFGALKKSFLTFFLTAKNFSKSKKYCQLFEKNL